MRIVDHVEREANALDHTIAQVLQAEVDPPHSAPRLKVHKEFLLVTFLVVVVVVVVVVVFVLVPMVAVEVTSERHTKPSIIKRHAGAKERPITKIASPCSTVGQA